MAILTAEGQIIEGVRGRLKNVGCRVDVLVGKTKFKDIRLGLDFESRELERILSFEGINGRIIELVIK